MGNKNGYFKLDVGDMGVVLYIYPPEDGGKPLEAKEVLVYLERRGYGSFDRGELNRALSAKEGEQRLYVGEWNGYEENESMEVNVSMDKMLAFCRFYPPSNKGKQMTEEAIVMGLESHKVIMGIRKEEILKFLKERQYCTDYVLAKGTPPVNGKDAKIEYFFNNNLNLRPKKNPDGTVDYHDLNTISHVEEGQMLAKLHPAVPGKPGIDVYGGDVNGRQEKNLKLEFGNNITLSEDQTEIYSDVTGHASLVNRKVFVANVFEVPADVDNTTGDVSYDGNVNIKGNVKSGFSVRAKGDIVIDGVVEAAYLSAGGQIIVKRGINGMGKGKVESKSNIITKFIENSIVVAGGFIETGSILHSRVSAGMDIRVSGKRGFVNGGVIRAGSLVEAQTIGSAMGGANTSVEVGVDPKVKERYESLQERVAQLQKEISQLRPALVNFQERLQRKEQISPERMKQVQGIAKSFKEKQQELAASRLEYQELHEQLQMSHSAKVAVKGSIYPGVSITISDVSMNIKSERSFSKFVKDRGEIVVRSL